MSDDRRRLSDGIEIDREIADAEGVPEDLDAGIVGPYRFPDPRRRRIAGWFYVVLAVALGIMAFDSPGFWFTAVLAAALAAWHMMAAWPLGIEQEDALDRAGSQVPFAVGHASAAVTFHGLRARPHWHVVVYSADEPPTQRALVQYDAVDGRQIDEVYVEAVPE